MRHVRISSTLYYRKLSIDMSYEHLEVIVHNDPDILEIIFKKNTRPAVDEYVQVMLSYTNGIREAGKLETPIYMIIDVSHSGMYPLNYGTAEVAKIIPKLKDIPKAYFAYIVDHSQDSFIIEQLKHFSSTRNQDSRRTFTGAERDKAVRWLLSNTAI